MSALLVLAGDDVVARLAVVRAILPGLAALADRGRHLGQRRSRAAGAGRHIGSSWLWQCPWDGLDDFDDEVVVLAFVQVRKLAGQRLEWPVNAVLSRVDRQLRSREAAFRRQPEHESLTPVDGPGVDVEAVGPRSGLELLLHEVHEAQRGGVVSAREARIIAADRVFGWATAEIAVAEGATVAAVGRARSRALRKLRAAMVDVDSATVPAACAG